MTESKPNPTTSGRRRRPQKQRSKAELSGLIADVVLVLVLVGSALAIGSVHIPTLLAVSAIALAGATVEVMALRRVPWPAVVLAAFGLFSALQAVSLPGGLVQRLSPVSASVWLRCLLPFGEAAPRNFALSLDPCASVAEALKWLTYAAVYIMAMRTRARRGSAWLAIALFGSVTLVSLITLLHGIADLPELYGLYQPDFTPGRWSVGPLLNSNNFAGYAILGLFTGGGLLLSGRSPVPRLALMIGMGLISAVLSLSGSRGGILCVLIGGAVSVVWYLRAKGSRISVRGVAFGLAPLVIGIVIAVLLGSESDARQLATLDVQRKTSVWLWSLPLIREHAVFGVGRGAFETAFPVYRGALDYDWAIVVTHAENFVIQWVAEWGVPVGACAVILITGYVLREWYRSSSDRLRFMVMTGLVALFVQNLADLGFEVPALVIAAVVALAAGEGATSVPAANETGGRLGKLAFAAVAPAFALWVATVVWSGSPVELERRELSAAYGALTANMSSPAELALGTAAERALMGVADEPPIQRPDEVGQFRTRLREAMLRHPGEAFFPLLGSLVASRTRSSGNPLTWIAHALELAPTNGPVHLVLADLMHSHGATSQAMMHLRLAAQYDRTLGGAVFVRAPAWAPSIDVLMQAIPDGPQGEAVLRESCARAQKTELKLECFRRAVQRNPNSPGVRLTFAETLLAAVQGRQAPCADALAEVCTAEAEAAIRAAAKLDTQAWRPAYLLSKILLARGDTVGAAQLLTKTCPMSPDGDDQCWNEALSVALKGGATDAISAAANALGARQCDGMESCARMFSSLANTLESGGQLALASKFYIKAAEAEPSAARWLKVAELATQAHLNGVARAALERANRSFDASPSTRANVEALRERVARTANSPL